MKKTYKSVIIAIVDALLANIAVYIALVLRLIDSPNETLGEFTKGYLIGAPMLAVLIVGFFYVFGIYRVIWRYARAIDAMKVVIATTISFSLYMMFQVVILESFNEEFNAARLPGFACFFGGVLALVLILGMRLIFRVVVKRRIDPKEVGTVVNRIMVIGGGSAGNMLLHDLKDNSAFAGNTAVCIIDDDPQKLGKKVYGVQIVGDRETIVENARKYNINEIIVAIPTLSPAERAKILEICTGTGCKIGILPSLDKTIGSKIGMNSVRKVNVEDLLGREPIRVNLNVIADYVRGKTVMVTGGGGSIGSELCRQIAGHNPKRLIIFDIYENNAYNILNELKTTHPELQLIALIGSVRDVARLEKVFSEYRPDIVYHAAAHKHVPLMEDSPEEAVKNNVFGTYNVVNAADKYGVSRFVMISTDKAVNPTNVMGATKRICEMIVQTKNRSSSTEFITVRFGNVLGSNGSVIPLFEKQIAEGGPVTVTDKRIVRYFMTIPEAVSLVLEAGAAGKGGEIFVLDMGKPMKIIDLAENMIRLSGYEPYVDIDIEFIGLRPGEKLYEELLMAEEGLKTTPNKMIYIGQPIKVDEKELERGLELLRNTIRENGDIREAIKTVVDTYNPSER